MGTQVSGSRPKSPRRIVVVQPHFRQGGAEAVAAWVVQALKDLAQVTVLTFDHVHPEELNRRFGTNLKAGDFEVVRCRFPFGGKAGNLDWTLLKLHWLMRQCKNWPEKDVLFFGASSEMDFGQPGLQYINFPQLAEHATRDMGLITQEKWWHRPSLFRRAYLRLGQRISGFSEEGVKANFTFTVSNWTGEIVRKVYGIPTKTVYPPVALQVPNIPFEARERGFVCIGRIVPSKRILEILAILSRVRAEGFNIHLHIIGPVGDWAYMRKVWAAQKRNSSWVMIEGPLNREELADLVAQHRFGIHGMLYEHFGIAVAEMAKAGCITFLSNTGGQVEIVDHDERLLYENKQDAVEKIARVLADENLQIEISREMMARASRFTVDRFIHEVREAVAQFS